MTLISGSPVEDRLFDAKVSKNFLKYVKEKKIKWIQEYDINTPWDGIYRLFGRNILVTNIHYQIWSWL